MVVVVVGDIAIIASSSRSRSDFEIELYIEITFDLDPSLTRGGVGFHLPSNFEAPELHQEPSSGSNHHLNLVTVPLVALTQKMH